MKKIILLFVATFFLSSFYAQEKKLNSADLLLKETIYNENRKKIMNYSMKDFDKLFFEFFEKKATPNFVLTKEEFYNYTIQIGTFSDRLAVLYPKQKEEAAESKKRWFSESYEDYLLSKEKHK